jgi:hypothetical protein
MTMKTNTTPCAANAVCIVAMTMLLASCGGSKGPDPAATQPGANGGQAQPGSGGNNAQGPDLSNLSEIVLAKINQDPTRKEMKVTAKLVEFNVKSAETQVFEGMAASSVVECAGVVVFDGDVEWSWQDSAPKKAGEPAKFECRVEYANQGQGWQLFGPMGIYPL